MTLVMKLDYKKMMNLLRGGINNMSHFNELIRQSAPNGKEKDNHNS